MFPSELGNARPGKPIERHKPHIHDLKKNGLCSKAFLTLSKYAVGPIKDKGRAELHFID